MNAPARQLTSLLVAWGNGDPDAGNLLFPLIETELRRMAHNYMRKENGLHTLQTSALVNEAYLKLVDQRFLNWHNRSQFYGISAQIMRRTLLNHARDRLAQKRGGGAIHKALDESEIMSAGRSRELVALDDALEKLAEFDKLKSKIVELRYFGGLTLEETADALAIAPITVSVNWRIAKAWLAREITGSLQS